MDVDRRDRIRGCLLAGAVGDALGAPVEFLSLAQIRSGFGPAGVTGHLPAYGRPGGAITDDTQMTLFTVEGLLRARVRSSHYGIVDVPGAVLRAYHRWLRTQGRRVEGDDGTYDRGLVEVAGLHAVRAPGTTCVAALASGRRASLAEPANDSKGCGAVMRSAPFGLTGLRPAAAFDLAVRCAVLTHGHPSGYLSAGHLAATVAAVIEGAPLPRALDVAAATLRSRERHEETLAAVDRARELATRAGGPTPERVESLGAGWVAEEALAIAVYCALAAPDLPSALLLAVNHSGDSDSTGSIAGHLLGALQGQAAVPSAWLDDLELADVIGRLADDLHAGFFEGAAGDEHLPITPEIQAFLDRYAGY